MNGALLYGATAGFACGILARAFFDFGSTTILLLAVLGAALMWLPRLVSANLAHTAGLMVGCVLVGASLGALRLDYEKQILPALAGVAESEVALYGRVVAAPDRRPHSLHLYIKEQHTGERVLAFADPFSDVAYGDVVRVTGTLETPTAFDTDLGRTFNYPGYLRARGVHHVLFFPEVTVIERGKGNPLIAWLLSVKSLLTSGIRATIEEPQAGLGEGLLLGTTRALGPELEAAFRRTGIIHIVVLSGYNVMIVAEAVMRLLSVFFSVRTRVVVGICAISLFALMVGLSATVVRASIMASLVLIARATGRIADVMRALMAAGVVMLLFNPYLVAFDPGFQLSFLATLGLILIAPHLETALRLVPTRFQVREFIVATIATQIMVLPLLLFLIGEMSLVAVAVNVLVLPAVPFAMLLSFLSALAGMLLPAVGVVLGGIAQGVLFYIVSVAVVFAALPFAAVPVSFFPLSFLALGYAIIAGLLFFLWRRTHRFTNRQVAGARIRLAGWTIVSGASEKTSLPPPV